MNNHHQAALPLDFDVRPLDIPDPSRDRPDHREPLDQAAQTDEPHPTHPNAATHVLRPRPSSKHTVAAFPPGKAADAVGVVADSEPAPLLLTIPEAGRLLGLGRTTMYELIGAGEVEVVHIGRAARIPFESVERFVDRLRSVSPTGR
jgi:excisionase family DNA binding protein